MLWEVATSLGTQEYRHLGIASHCSESAPVCNQCILFCTYNESLVHVIKKQSCKDNSVFARKLFPICLHYSIVFKAKHIPGVCNKLADAPSCLQVHTFKQLAPAYMDPFPTELPQSLRVK